MTRKILSSKVFHGSEDGKFVVEFQTYELEDSDKKLSLIEIQYTGEENKKHFWEFDCDEVASLSEAIEAGELYLIGKKSGESYNIVINHIPSFLLGNEFEKIEKRFKVFILAREKDDFPNDNSIYRKLTEIELSTN